MRFIRYRRLGDAEPRLAVDLDDREWIVDLRAQHPQEPSCATLQELIRSGTRGLELAWAAYVRPMTSALVRWADIVLLPPLQPPAMEDCGMIRTHLRPIRAEMCRWIVANTDDPRDPLELTSTLVARSDPRAPLSHASRDHSEVTGPNDVIERPAGSRVLDYELELGVVIGADGENVSRADAEQHIFGYTIYNDWSLRDVQISNILAGGGVHGTAKDFPGSNTIGPCVVTKDEIPDPYDLAMTVRVNGETWGSGSSSQAWCRFEDAIVTISAERPIKAGEVWGSGTVRNGSSFEVGRRLPNHAYVELEIERLGVLANFVVPGE